MIPQEIKITIEGIDFEEWEIDDLKEEITKCIHRPHTQIVIQCKANHYTRTKKHG